jgi:hypothetical protein
MFTGKQLSVKKQFLRVLVFLVSCGAGVRAQDKPWLEVRSPHFRGLTDGSGETRHVARAEARGALYKCERESR